MSYTLVSSFVLQKRDIGNTQKIQDYLKRFEYIKNLNIPTVLFLDKTISMEETETLKIVPYSIEDTWCYKEYSSVEPSLPTVRNHEKDTFDYLVIQNSKPEWVFKVSRINPFNTDYFVWVDFGLSHVIKNKDNFNILKTLKPSHDICLSVITDTIHPFLSDRICWRYAGGVFYISKIDAELFYETCKAVLQHIRPRITWEVNIWALIEVSKLLKLNFYYADHNDTLLTNLSNVV